MKSKLKEKFIDFLTRNYASEIVDSTIPEDRFMSGSDFT